MRKQISSITLDADVVAWLNTFENKSGEANRILRLYYDYIVKKEVSSEEQAMVMIANAKETIKKLEHIIEMIRADKIGNTESQVEN